MFPPTPPLTPYARPTPSIDTRSTGISSSTAHRRSKATSHSPQMKPTASPSTSPDFALPPPISFDSMPNFELPEPTLDFIDIDNDQFTPRQPGATLSAEPEYFRANTPTQSLPYPWRADLSPQERDDREVYLSSSRGRAGLRIVIVTENFLPKVDGVTRTLARLLEHLEKEGHQCMLLGPETNMESYASHPLVGTAGVPLVVYPGLKLNFLRPKFMRSIKDFQPDVIHFVDPIWLGAQTLMAMELGWAGEEWVSDSGPALGSGIRGAVVASYHTNLATYATLFGMAWLEPIMWKFQSWLYSKTLLTLCPSPSTLNMLEGQSFSGVRLWPRGVDLSQFGRHRRSAAMRASWGVGEILLPEKQDQRPIGTHWQGQQASLPLTPPLTPWTGPVDHSTVPTPTQTLPSRVVLLYVGRVSWEKNLHLLLAAYARLAVKLAREGADMPKMVFVGDGPARAELESICEKKGYDAVFMGHRSGQELAECYASADVFAFPSFTETFGQVVLEALASGLPVIGLDAEGTRDLVQHSETGLLLSIPASAMSSSNPSRTWPLICRDNTSAIFAQCAEDYAALLARAICEPEERRRMGSKGSTEGIKGYTWWDAMERCVDGYRESMRMARQNRHVEVITHDSSTPSPEQSANSTPVPQSPRTSRMNRLVSRRLAHKGEWTNESEVSVDRKSGAGLFRRARSDSSETIWHLKTLLKLLVVLALFYGVYRHHLGALARSTGLAGAQVWT